MWHSQNSHKFVRGVKRDTATLATDLAASSNLKHVTAI